MPSDSAIIAVASAAVVPAGSVTTPEVTACSAEPVAADMVCEPARMPPAAPTGKASQRVPSTTRPKPRDDDTMACTVNFSPSPFRLFTNDGPTRKPTPYMNR